MNEKDLMNAMNDIDESLFDFEEKKKKLLKGSWKMLIAAALVMAFSVTAYAIGNITTSQKTKIYDADDIWRLCYDTEGRDEVEFYEMSVEYQLEPQKVSEKFHADAVAALNFNYECMQQTYEAQGEEYNISEGEELRASWNFYSDHYNWRNDYTIEEIEKYIGLDLCLSDELKEGIDEIANRRKAGKTSLMHCNITVIGKKTSKAEGNFIPLYAEIHFTADRDDKGNQVNAVVFISLSEEKATAKTVWNSFEKEGRWTERIMKTDSGREIYFIHNNPKKDYHSKARACWTESGIAYCAYTNMAYDWEHKDEAVKYLKPFIENLE
ncbi:MAG: hypothetical protein IJZ58_01215 [Oscillospiraceae bacterium]|nr:hypothetical protein [Oscillospiraceae bacterium]